MNVLHLIDTLDLGGAQVIVKNFIESDLPHNQYVFALRTTKICIPINGKVTVFPGEARYSFKPIKSICDFIKNKSLYDLTCKLFSVHLISQYHVQRGRRLRMRVKVSA